jgi:hypothetical protein
MPPPPHIKPENVLKVRFLRRIDARIALFIYRLFLCANHVFLFIVAG